MLGALIGDIAGSRFEWNNIKTKEFELFTRRCEPTDDSFMSLAIAKALLCCKTDYSDLSSQAIKWMQQLGRKYPNGGYGGSFERWIYAANPYPYNSWGNGSAMRVSACAHVAASLEEAIRLSKTVTEVTHNHPEGVKGAEATTVAVYMALHGVPHNKAAEINEFFAPYRAKRNERNRKMVAAINEMMGKYGVTIDFEKDVLPLSNFAKGGSVTERHLPDVRDVLALSDRVGAISAYAYLGDVGDSVTGDKRAQKFEDDFLDELVEYVAKLGYRAITYMPSRNTKAQLHRLRALCEKYNLFQISGEDINQPRQSFVCEAQRDPEFNNLYDATWALIAHEWRATENPDDGFFSAKSIEQWPELNDRIAAFSQFGQAMRK